MTTPNGLSTGGSITQYGSWSEVQERTEEDWKAGEYNQWAEAMAGIPKIGDKLEQIPIIGGALSDFFEIVTGIPDSDENDAGSFIVNFFSGIRNSLNGGANPSPENSLISAVFGLLRGVNTKTNQTANLVSTGVNGQVVSQGVIDGLQYQLQVFTANGTFTPSTPPAGYEIAYYIGTVYGGGYSGDRNGDNGYNELPRGGRSGGRRSRRISVAEMGSSQAITVGSGGAARTSAGVGNAGGITSIGSLLSSSAGSSSIPTPYGDLPSSGEPGKGGDGGQLVGNSDRNTATPGAPGEDTSGALGGVGGAQASGWFGSARSPGVGGTGTIDGDHTNGGAGGGGGGAGNAGQNGAAGGAPGGGGGGAGAGKGSIYGVTVGSGAGARGQADILTVFKEV